MKIFVANYQPDKIGGGWSFARNFVKGMGKDITTDYNEANIYFITSASMVARHEVQQAQSDGKTIVLRCDNILRPSRNRGGGMSHMRDYADMADLIIFQSEAARSTLVRYLSYNYTKFPNTKTILNATDEDIFYSDKVGDTRNYLYSRFNRDETKNFEVARSWFAEQYSVEFPSTIYFAGQFSPELVENNFDLYNDEQVKYMGTVENPFAMADIYKTCGNLIYPYWNDACSNTLIEALMCNCMIQFPDEYYRKGSANEILTLFDLYGKDYFKLHRMCSEYRNAMREL